jgi:hypothetical protein
MGSCFVIMGFGEKTDFQPSPQRVLNLKRTYEDIIKPVVEQDSPEPDSPVFLFIPSPSKKNACA